MLMLMLMNQAMYISGQYPINLSSLTSKFFQHCVLQHKKEMLRLNLFSGVSAIMVME